MPQSGKKYLIFVVKGVLRLSQLPKELCLLVAPWPKQHRTMKVYPLAVHFSSHFGGGSFLSLLHHLWYTLQGINRSETQKCIEGKAPGYPYHPETDQSCLGIISLRCRCGDVVGSLLPWFLRSAEMTMPSDTAYDPPVTFELQ